MDLKDGCRAKGFTLVEMMVATAILVLILALVASMTDQVGKVWKRSNAQIGSFEAARAAYATMTMRLRQATLNTYLDYYDVSGNQRTSANTATFVPASYARASDLHFVVDQAGTIVPGTATTHPTQAVFFQAPLGFTLVTASYGNLPKVLNACGYYIEFNSDKAYYPSFLNSTTVKERYRYRLMEFLQPTEALSIYSIPNSSAGTPPAYDNWFYNFLPPTVPQASAPLRMLSENIIALIILPELSPHDQSGSTLAPNYTYDSRAGTIATLTHNQLPPLLRVVMVAIDEPSAVHMTPNGTTTPPSLLTGLLSGGAHLFQTCSNLDADINTLTQALSTQKIAYRVFDTDIAIRGAKWSTQ